MVVRGFAVHAGHVFYQLARYGRGKPIEESHTAGLTRIESIQHVRVSAVVQRILCQHGVIVPADDGFVVPPTGIGAEVGNARANIGVRLVQLCRNVRPSLPDQLHEHCLHSIVANEGFVAALSASLVAAITEAAPRVRLRFAPKPEKDARPLREGQIDLEIGVLGAFAPEVRTQSLFRDRFVGVARIGHPLLSDTHITPERYAACGHVVASRKGEFTGPVDDALEEIGLQRTVSIVVPGFPDAMRIARHSDLVALVPHSCIGNSLEDDRAATTGLQSFELPVRTPEIVISAMWHPRLDADPAHRWLRDTVVSVCRTANQRR
jgi:DNA-binding transcriptional LysR family regulator